MPRAVMEMAGWKARAIHAAKVSCGSCERRASRKRSIERR
jgi:hypothetical protein